MTLPQPTSVGTAISGDTPVDIHEWITVDIVGPPSAHRRGYAAFAEPFHADGYGSGLARQVREVILRELRAYPRQAPDELLARALGIANTLVLEDAHQAGVSPVLIGVTAVILEDHTATIAHVPPGQLILIQDHLVYGVPDLGSRKPHWMPVDSQALTPEPLGYSQRLSPLLVETELLPGDTIILCDENTAKVVASADNGDQSLLATLHAASPDNILDEVSDIAIEADIPFFAAAVIAFPPDPVISEIHTLGDVGRNARNQLRHLRAEVRSFLPKRTIPPSDAHEEPAEEAIAQAATTVAAPQPQLSLQERLIRFTEGKQADQERTWQPRREEQLYGAPGTHGVRRHRKVTVAGDGFNWKGLTPRVPFLNGPLFIVAVLAVLFLVGFLVYGQRDFFLPNPSVYSSVLAEADQRIIATQSMDDPEQVREQLDAAEANLERARSLGAPRNELDTRFHDITIRRDEVDHIYRVSNVHRIGSLPDELRDSLNDVLMTPGGIFFTNGDLYRLNPDTAEMQLMLERGREIKLRLVGPLFAVGYDGSYLVTTDGKSIFFASSTDGANWQSMEMERVNTVEQWDPGQIDAFSGKLYLLQPQFRNIYSFTMDPDKPVAAPVDWVSTGDRINLNIAVDLAIDGNIYVLLEDGQIIVYRSGLEARRFELPGFDFAKQDPVALVHGAATGYLYVAVHDHDGGGRIIAIDNQGVNYTILELPIDYALGEANVSAPYRGLQAIAVDEQRGILYLVNEDAVWSFNYSLPALPTPVSATPEVQGD